MVMISVLFKVEFGRTLLIIILLTLLFVSLYFFYIYQLTFVGTAVFVLYVQILINLWKSYGQDVLTLFSRNGTRTYDDVMGALTGVLSKILFPLNYIILRYASISLEHYFISFHLCDSIHLHLCRYWTYLFPTQLSSLLNFATTNGSICAVSQINIHGLRGTILLQTLQ